MCDVHCVLITKSLMKNFQEKYDEYTTNISHKGAAISLETVILLCEICENFIKSQESQIWVDTGSGFSSYVLRFISREFKTISVYSFDDNQEWLQKTIDFCKKNDVSTENILLWDDTHVQKLKEQCTVIFHDLGNRKLRSKTIASVIEMLKNDGIIIFDDMHKGDLKSKIEKCVENAKLEFFDLEETKTKTIDEFGRWVAVAKLELKHLDQPTTFSS